MRAFLFDLDGTLVDSERENADSVVEVLRARGRQVSDEERAFVVGHGWREIYDHLVAGGGVTLGYDELKERAAIVKERLCEARGLRILPGAVAFVRRAASFGPCAVVTGSSRREAEWTLRKLALDGAVRAGCASCPARSPSSAAPPRSGRARWSPARRAARRSGPCASWRSTARCARWSPPRTRRAASRRPTRTWRRRSGSACRRRRASRSKIRCTASARRRRRG